MAAAGLAVASLYSSEEYWPSAKLRICVTGAGGFIVRAQRAEPAAPPTCRLGRRRLHREGPLAVPSGAGRLVCCWHA